jgi:phosphate transport system substrate-binding protein
MTVLRRSLLTLGIIGTLATPVVSGLTAQVRINGAGATFPNIIYQTWILTYNQKFDNVEINYQSIGSGGGIRQFSDKTVDFGGSDAPMTDSAIAAIQGNVLHVPTVLGAVVPTYNLPGVSQPVRFTPGVLADIFLGNITNWNDARIASDNPGLTLPRQDIIVVHRSDGSGTTYVWVDYLTKVSPEWAQKVGRGTSVNWPVGLGGRGNEGVTATVRQTPGGIGYVELGYALINKMAFGLVRNKSGNWITPSLESVTAAAQGAMDQMGPSTDFRVSITDSPGAQAYPIASFTWVLLRKEYPDHAKGRELVKFVWWSLTEGQAKAPGLGYAPLPKEIRPWIEARLRSVTAGGRPAWQGPAAAGTAQ